ncbi:HalOD1 output domain-containing protein [Natrinema caseinilyticum]|uniref:HalOD1 output domain-containing protein n=1 Tax=Natrinema caseinilyticum TaxID=2961570 RepID=UPI0020C40B26|nr:HalOD1 output domain-containing protein [Natrinema caseinilyticum]
MMEGGDNIAMSSGGPPSRAVIEAIADAEGVQPAEIVPPAYESLYAAVDPDALDALFGDRSSGVSRSRGTVSFEFCGYEVTIDRDGRVLLEDLSGTTD